ncbi:MULTISPECIES: TRAP transporter large permease [Dethiosulfovibrio]|uniref:TRAP transporter large permease n=2 Tax=Dethiosulfovibrio TaxID=47054 RepID=A0ABS9EN70_9BACT|nr:MULTISPECIES: TRAP transporter large permease [Dethiosulfovibrio]MCF4112856.1 TRAP transporter large permease [Dethiosulfovibrio russensis]MCF4141320.1 TRAP transporter large permease [Dethiosulfovibrio marinus]MCF4145650.1 TRAP transporter large permease [Dethiosulfovibrio acidaminovorans]
MAITIALILIIVTLLLGLPVPFCFMLSTLFMVVSHSYDPSFLLPYSFSQMSSLVLLAIPLFIMVGGLMDRGGIGSSLVKLVEVFVGRIKGGLGVVAVVSCAVFGSISGSCAATLSCIGSIMFPRLRENGYPMGHSAALVSCAAPLGLLIPPSSQMILYAWVGQQSVLACFLATVGPGLLLMVLLSIINLVLLKDDPNVHVSPPITGTEKRKILWDRSGKALPALIMPVIVLGGIYGGIMTPTEAAAVAVLYSVPVGFLIYKGLNKDNFLEVVIETATTTGVVMLMMFCIMMLSRIYVQERLPSMIIDLLTSISSNKYVIMLMINLFMIIIGMIMDDVSAMLLCTPILLPVVTKLGISPIHFAAIIGVNLGLGNVTPPTAPTLYFGGRIANTPVSQMLRPAMIFILFAWLPTLVAVTYIPELSLWLPRLVLGGRF